MRKSGNTTLKDIDNDKDRYVYFCVPNVYFKSYVTVLKQNLGFLKKTTQKQHILIYS